MSFVDHLHIKDRGLLWDKLLCLLLLLQPGEIGQYHLKVAFNCTETVLRSLNACCGTVVLVWSEKQKLGGALLVKVNVDNVRIYLLSSCWFCRSKSRYSLIKPTTLHSVPEKCSFLKYHRIAKCPSDISSTESRNVLLTSLPTEALSGNTVWLVLDEEGSLRSADDIYLPIDSQVYGFESKDDKVEIIEVYQVSPATSLISLPYGSWNGLQGLNLSETPLVERRKDLRGHIFTGQTVFEPPYVTFDPKLKTVQKIEGIVGDLWHGILEKSLNFTTKIVPSLDGQWGAALKNGR